jgi:hypothetical protein
MDVETATSKTRDSEVAKSEESHSQEGRISIWFFIGMLLLVYGLLILGAGIYDLLVPPAQPPVLAGLHAGIWWGGLLAIIGGLYSYRFFPRRDRREDR